MKRAGILCGLLGCFLIPGVTHSQIVHGQKGYVSPRLVYQVWSVKDTAGVKETTSQWFCPLEAYLPLADNLEVRIRSGFSGSTLDPSPGEAMDLTGLVDTRIQGAYTLYDDRLLIHLGVSVPTGKTRLTTQEWSVSDALYTPAFGFPVKRMGEGVGLSVGGALAERFGPAVASGGVSYLWKAAYDPREDATDYKPGSETTAVVGIDFPGRHTLLRTDLTYTAYGADTQGGRDVLQNGSQIKLTARFAYRGHPWALRVTGMGISRGGNRYPDQGALRQEEKNSHGKDLRLHVSLRFALTNALGLKGTLQTKRIHANEYDSGDASVVALGGAVQWVANARLTMEGGVRGFIGSMDGGDKDIRGVELGGGCLFRL